MWTNTEVDEQRSGQSQIFGKSRGGQIQRRQHRWVKHGGEQSQRWTNKEVDRQREMNKNRSRKTKKWTKTEENKHKRSRIHWQIKIQADRYTVEQMHS